MLTAGRGVGVGAGAEVGAAFTGAGGMLIAGREAGEAAGAGGRGAEGAEAGTAGAWWWAGADAAGAARGLPVKRDFCAMFEGF
jgi:hypothetical protein